MKNNILKTKMVDRFFNISPKICIYDLDGTIIDSSHRATHDKNGMIDLDNWIANSTKDLIYQDKLMPLYAQLVADYKNGNMVILCTARNLGIHDWEYIHAMGIYYDRVISRPNNNMTKDNHLKKSQLRYLRDLPQYKDKEKIFYDDNQSNLNSISDLGFKVVDAKGWG